MADRGPWPAVDALYEALAVLGRSDDEVVATGIRDRVVYEDGTGDEWWTVLSLSVGDAIADLDSPSGRRVCYAAVALLAAWGPGADPLDPSDRIAAEVRLGLAWRAATNGGS